MAAVGCGMHVTMFAAAAVALSLVLGTAFAQVSAGLAGTWVLDQLGGRGAPGGRGFAVPGFPVATLLAIKVTPGEVIVDSDTGSAQSIQTFVYKLDGSVTSVPGPLGWETTAKAAIDGGALRVTVTRSITGPNGPIGASVVEVYRVDGDTLVLERTLGSQSQKLVYRRKS